MDLIYIYGPPGVGKFTVATELAKITGYRLFHNQLSIEFVKSVFDFGTEPFNRLVLRYRAEIIEEAAKQDVSVIFTSAYVKGLSDPIIKDIVKRVERHGGRVCFVQLFCKREELFRRVSSRSRMRFYKIRSVKFMKELLGKYNHFSRITFRRSLSIDNTRLGPADAAEKIARHYRL
jgi:tRNA uridine 5-carbamoylmethylation protein Kti12